MTPELSMEPERFQTKLRQIHLPLLADAEYVEWSKDPIQVRRGPGLKNLPASWKYCYRLAIDYYQLL